MPGPEGIGAHGIDLIDSRELVETIELTLDLDCDVTCELPQPAVSSPPGAVAIAPRPVASGIAAISGTPLAGRYELGEPLARGGTAIIFRARDLSKQGPTRVGQPVAIKLLRPVLHDRPQSIARLQREFRQTRSLPHPNIVRHYELGCDRGAWFIAMELLTGEALGDRLRRMPSLGLPMHEALRIAAACGDALAYAHAHGVTHGDVKPDNVFLTDRGEVRLLDFGIAGDTLPPQPGLRLVGTVTPAATLAYASPQVLAGEMPQSRDDVYSLACLVCEMLAGRHPRACPGTDQDRQPRLALEPLPGLTVRQWSVLAAGMAPRREQRPAGIRELLQALFVDADMVTRRDARPRIGAGPPTLRTPTLRTPTARARRDARVVAGAAVLGMLVGASGSDSEGPGPPTVSAVAPAQASAAVPRGQVTPELPVNVRQPLLISSGQAAPDAARPPAPLPRVSFEVDAMAVSSSAFAAAIPILRDGPLTRRASVDWRVLDGSAIAGRDYGGPRRGVARFAEGVRARTLYVPILHDGGTTAARSFTVELTEASPGAGLGRIRRVSVTIEGHG